MFSFPSLGELCCAFCFELCGSGSKARHVVSCCAALYGNKNFLKHLESPSETGQIVFFPLFSLNTVTVCIMLAFL